MNHSYPNACQGSYAKPFSRFPDRIGRVSVDGIVDAPTWTGDILFCSLEVLVLISSPEVDSSYFFGHSLDSADKAFDRFLYDCVEVGYMNFDLHMVLNTLGELGRM